MTVCFVFTGFERHCFSTLADLATHDVFVGLPPVDRRDLGAVFSAADNPCQAFPSVFGLLNGEK